MTCERGENYNLRCLRTMCDVRATYVTLLNYALWTQSGLSHQMSDSRILFNPFNAELNPICYLVTLLGAHHFLHVRRIRVKLLPIPATTH
jgi:hypothetical protein